MSEARLKMHHQVLTDIERSMMLDASDLSPRHNVRWCLFLASVDLFAGSVVSSLPPLFFAASALSSFQHRTLWKNCWQL